MMTEHQINERWHEVEHQWSDHLARIKELTKYPPPEMSIRPGPRLLSWLKAMDKEERVALMGMLIDQNPEDFIKAPNGRIVRVKSGTKH